MAEPTLPEVSIATSSAYGVPFDAQVPLIAEAGSTHLSLGAREDHSGYLSAEGRQRIRTLLRAYGLAMEAIHGPRLDQPDSVTVLSVVTRAAAELQAAVVVFHPARSIWRRRAAGPPGRRAADLCGPGACRQAGSIRYALENVLPGPATELVTRVLDDLDPAVFGFCYDSAHDQIGGPRPFTLLRQLGARFIAVQLSDRIRDYVDHVLPGDGFIQWPRLCAGLRQSAFRGPVLLEAATTHSAEQGDAPLLAAGAR